METGFIYKKVMTWDKVDVFESEVYRYLGYSGRNGKEQIRKDARTERIVTETIEELHHALSPQAVYAEYPVSLEGEGVVNLGFTRTQSYNLCKNLDKCDKIILFAATLGPKVDLLIQKNSRINPLKGVIMQAAGAMFIESFCDTLNEEWNKEQAQAGYQARPRFSPGYGDFQLDTQKSIFKALACPQKIGLTLMDTIIMAPGKSVTAVIGYQKKEKCTNENEQSLVNKENRSSTIQHKCEECILTECEFRQKGTI